MRIVVRDEDGLEETCRMLDYEAHPWVLMRSAGIPPQESDVTHVLAVHLSRKNAAPGTAEVCIYGHDGTAAPLRIEKAGGRGEAIVRLLHQTFGVERIEYEGREVRVPARLRGPLPESAMAMVQHMLDR